jgi:hypothetical protein
LTFCGLFSGAGGKAAYNFAHWNAQKNFDVQPFLGFGAPQRLPNGYFQFCVTSSNVGSYVIEASTSFSNWVALSTNTQGSLLFQDPAAPGFTNRFHRTRQLQ